MFFPKICRSFYQSGANGNIILSLVTKIVLTNTLAFDMPWKFEAIPPNWILHDRGVFQNHIESYIAKDQ